MSHRSDSFHEAVFRLANPTLVAAIVCAALAAGCGGEGGGGGGPVRFGDDVAASDTAPPVGGGPYFRGKANAFVDAVGTIHVVFGESGDSNFAKGIAYVKSTDGGASFSGPVWINFGQLSGNRKDSPVVGASADGQSVHVAVMVSEQTGWSPWYARSTDGGSTFAPARQLNSPYGYAADSRSMWISIDVTSAGNVLLAWADDDWAYGPSDWSDVCLAWSIDGGQNFSVARITDTGGTGGASPPDSGRHPVVRHVDAYASGSAPGFAIAYQAEKMPQTNPVTREVRLVTGTAGAGVYASMIVSADVAGKYEDHVQPSLAVDGAGNAFLAWRANATGKDYDVLACRVPLSGAPAPQVAVTTASDDDERPAIFVEHGGRVVDVAWWHHPAFVPTTGDIYFARSLDFGATFGKEARVDHDQGATGQFDPAIASDGNGRVSVAFEDWQSGIPVIRVTTGR